MGDDCNYCIVVVIFMVIIKAPAQFGIPYAR